MTIHLPLDVRVLGFKSDWADQDRHLICWSSIQTLILPAVWHGELPWWKYQSSELGDIVLAEGSKCSFRISLYVAWVVHSSQRHICPDHHWVSFIFYSWCETLWVVGFSRSLCNHNSTRCWAKLKIELAKENDLTPILCSPIPVVFGKPQPVSSLPLTDKGLFLALHNLQSWL